MKIIILGAKGNSLDILDTILDLRALHGASRYDCLGFLDDDQALWNTQVAGLPVLGGLAKARSFNDARFVNGIGSVTNFRKRHEIIASTGLAADRFVTLVHPSAHVSRTARLGTGTVIFPLVVVEAHAELGEHVIVLSQSVINHDVVVGAYTCVASGVCVAGRARIGRNCYLGSNSAIRNDLEVGPEALVGMGAVVVKPVAAGAVVAGNPAKPVRH